MSRLKPWVLPFFLLITSINLASTNLLAYFKAPVSPEAAKASLLVGRWQLTQTDGGPSGLVQTANPAQKHELIFDKGKATFLVNGKVNVSCAYKLFQANSFLNRRPQTFLAYGRRNSSPKEFIERISESQLVLVEDRVGGIGYYYSRR
jgi:hypothetical protein